MSTPSPKTFVEQYKIAVELYKHEDNLNWTKLSHLFYINAGLATIIGFIIEYSKPGKLATEYPYFLIGMVSLIGVIVSVAFGMALWFGIKYMHNRKDAVIAIEEILVEYGGTHIVSPRSGKPNEKGILKRSPTTLMMKIVAFIPAVIWIIIFIANMRWLKSWLGFS